MLQLLSILAKLPAILSIILEVIKLVELAFPKSPGPVKLEAAVSAVQTILPDVITVAHAPALSQVINLVVGLLNRPGGAFAEAKQPVDTSPSASG